MARCQDCGEHSPDQASFCIVCGARLIAPAARARVPIPPAVGPTIRLNPADTALPSVRGDHTANLAARPGIGQALVSLVGLVYGTAVVLGLAQLFANYQQVSQQSGSVTKGQGQTQSSQVTCPSGTNIISQSGSVNQTGSTSDGQALLQSITPNNSTQATVTATVTGPNANNSQATFTVTAFAVCAQT